MDAYVSINYKQLHEILESGPLYFILRNYNINDNELKRDSHEYVSSQKHLKLESIV